MKKTVVMAALLTLVTATGALAEHRLLVTSVPEKGQAEARLDVAYSKADGDGFEDEKSGAVATVGYGVTDSLKLSASLPYTFVQHEDGVKKDGFGDITLGARYALSKKVKLPLDAAIGIDWKTTTASDGEEDMGSKKNNYAPYLAVSKNLHTVIPYLKYQPEFIAKKHHGQTVHNLTAGAEIEFGHHYTLDVAVKASANGRSEGVKSSNDVEFEVAPYIEVAKNLYILPKVAYKVIGDRSEYDGTPVFKNADEYSLALGAYYLFK